MRCSLCGGELKEKIISYEVHFKEKLYGFEDVPALVCESCGDISFSSAVAKEMDRIIKGKGKPEKYQKVPVFSLRNLCPQQVT